MAVNVVRRIYTPEQKADALRIMAANFGDIARTSHQTGIPPRTLRTWRSVSRQRQTDTAALPEKISVALPPVADPADTEPIDAATAARQFEQLRARLMQRIFDLVNELSTDHPTAGLNAVAIARLLDRVLKLDEVIPALRPPPAERVYRVEYKYPDGTIHDIPPWADETYRDRSDW